MKADQWQSCIEFDVPVAIAQIWDFDRPGCEENKRVQRQKKLVEATLLLAMAIRWATSYRTSVFHASQYMICITAYLNILKALYPTLAWRLNHHAALHIGPLLLNFGPCMAGGCSCMRGSLGFSERQTPILELVSYVFNVFLSVTS